jgi:hypothetical protein
MASAGSSILLATNAVRDKAIALALRGRDAPFADGVFQDVVAANGGLALWTRSIWGVGEALLEQSETDQRMMPPIA